MAPPLNSRNINVQRSVNPSRAQLNTPRHLVRARDENKISVSPAPGSKLPLPSRRTPGRSTPAQTVIIHARQGVKTAPRTDKELPACPVEEPQVAVQPVIPYNPDVNLKSHWSVDTPETPSSPVATFPAHNNSSNSWSSAMINPAIDRTRPRSISMTDRTSKVTASTLDNTELNNDTTELTQYSPSVHDEQSRTHSPPPASFSQPRLNSRRSSLPGTPTIKSRSRHHATASRIPIYDPGKAPNLIDIRPPRTPVPSTPGTDSDTPTFGGRRLDTPADLAALDKDPTTRRQPSNRTPEQESSDKFGPGLAKKVSMANMKNQVRRLTPSPSATDVLRRASHHIIPHEPVLQRDPHSQHELDTTLALLEGTPPSVTPTNDDFLAFANNYSRKLRHRVEPANQEARSPAPSDTTSQNHVPVNRQQAERLPSYMSPTPASQGRRVSRLQVSDHRKQESISRHAIGENTPTPLPQSRSAARFHLAPSPLQPPGDDNTLNIPQHPELKDFKPKSRPRSDSKSRLFNNFKGLFTSKRDAAIPPVPSLDGKRLNKQPDKTHEDPFPPFEHGKSLIAVTAPSEIEDATKKYNIDASNERKTDDMAAVVGATHALIAEAAHKGDSVKRERLVSLAKVMMDTIANSREAERSMIIAQQAALSAKMSYEMTQQSVMEMGRLITTSKGSMAGVLKRMAVRAGHR